MQVGTATGSGTTLASPTMSFKGGSLVVVQASFGNTEASGETCADSTSANTWSAIGTGHLWDSNPSILQGQTTFYAYNIAAFAGTVTVSWGASINPTAVKVIEFYWPNTSDPLDQNTGTIDDPIGTGTDNLSAGSITPSVNGCLIYCGGFAVFSSSPTITAGTGFTLIGSNINPDTFSTIAAESFVQATAAAKAGTFTCNQNGGGGARVISFKPQAVGAGSLLWRPSPFRHLLVR